MNAKEKSAPANESDLQLAFDVGHSSIGWAVFEYKEPSCTELLGCGVLGFQNDDCLASKRRQFRSVRRHARSTRRRIEKLAKLLLRLVPESEDDGAGLLLANLRTYETASPAERAKLQGKGDAAPWLIAARVLTAHKANDALGAKLTWPELWEVLRWYAHNRGYDHETWGDISDDLLTDAERETKEKDTEKVERAKKLMNDLGTNSMAETVFRYLFKRFSADDPRKVERLPFFQDYFKGEKCAFERQLVRREVREILEAQRALFDRSELKAEAFIMTLLDDWRAADRIKAGVRICGKRGEKEKLWLPKRYGKRQPDGSLVNGGLLFGRLSARFLNRIVSDCPLTNEKVPNKHCREFLEFRWAEQVAKIEIEAPVPPGEESQFRDYKPGELRSLSASERQKVDALARARGFLRYQAPKPDKKSSVLKGCVNDLGDILRKATNCRRSNLDKILLVPGIEQALRLLPIAGDADAKSAFQSAWGCFPEPKHDPNGIYRDDRFRQRFTVQLLRGAELCAADIAGQLRRIGQSELAETIESAVRARAVDRKGGINEEKANELLQAKFRCDKIQGRAPYSREKLRQAVQQIFHSNSPMHPLAKNGCLEPTDEVKDARLARQLEALTNNHLVRHRLRMLERVNKQLVEEFAHGNRKRIARIVIEVARDLQTMSGMTSQEKARSLGTKQGHFDKTATKVAEVLAEENAERQKSGKQPLPISWNLIRKARIADELGWQCPYTGQQFHIADLIHRTFDKDHIIPRSKRLSDALEAMVLTTTNINSLKDNLTALEFIKQMSRPENEEKRKALGILTEAQFRTLAEALPPKTDPFAAARAGRKVSDDDKRRWRRKQLLLTEKWDKDEFKPGDLSKTSHIIKLARQRLEAQFKDIPVHQRPPILNIPGAVTAAFRDKSWRLLAVLAAVHPEVKKLHEQAEAAHREGRDFNFKKAVRGVTRLHHALDAIAIGLIAERLVPHGSAARAGLNDTLVRLIIKGKLTAEERRDFERLRHELGLNKFYRWSSNRCNDIKSETPGTTEGGRLCIDDLSPTLKTQIQRELSKKRVAQHVPADMSSLGRRVTQNTSGILRVRDAKGNLLWQKGRHGDEELRELATRDRCEDLYLELTAPIESDEDEPASKAKQAEAAKPIIKSANQVVGFAPIGGVGKLTPVRGVRIIRDNYGLAILDSAPPGEEKFAIIPQHKVWWRINDDKKGLIARNGGKPPRIIRNGSLIRLKNTKPGKQLDTILMVRSVKASLKLDLTHVDLPDVKDSGYGIWREVSVRSLGPENIEILPSRILGFPQSSVAACPITSSA